MQNPYLVLRGPVRGVMFGDLVVFEVLLYVRGTTKSDDRDLSLLAPWYGKGDRSSLIRALLWNFTLAGLAH